MGACTQRDKRSESNSTTSDIAAQKTEMLERYLTQVADAKLRRLEDEPGQKRTAGGKASRTGRAKTTSTYEDTTSSFMQSQGKGVDSSADESSDEETYKRQESAYNSDGRSARSHLEELRFARSCRLAKARQMVSKP
jgi:hypothetical protein